MKANTVIFWSVWVIIGILVLTNLQMDKLEVKFDKYCKIQYNLDDGCPCQRMVSQVNQLDLYVNLSSLNLTHSTE